jgi:general secretion pathway protein D
MTYRSVLCLLCLIPGLAGCSLLSFSDPRATEPEQSAKKGSTSVEVRAEPTRPPTLPPASTPPPELPSIGAAPAPEALPPLRPTSRVQAPPPLPAAAETPAPSTVQSPQRSIILNFDNAELETVLQAAAEISPFNYVLAPSVRDRKITVRTTGKISSEEIFPVLLTILDVNGLTAVRSGNLYRIIPREGAPQTSVKTIVGREVTADLVGDEVFTQVVPLRFISATEAVTLLRPFVPQQGAVAAHREMNLLIITDAAANVRRLLELLKIVDVEVALDELQIIQIQHADARELAQLLSQLFASGRLRSGGASLLPSLPIPQAPAAAGGAPRPVAPSPEGGPAGDRAPLIVAERRSNSLVVHAGKMDIEAIRRLIEKLDVDIYGGQRVFFYFAEHTKARDLATTLEAVYGRGDRGPAITGTQSQRGPTTPGPYGPGVPAPLALPPAPSGPQRPAGPAGSGLQGDGTALGTDVHFIADEVTNAIIVTTYPRLWKEIEVSIKTLDRMPRQVLIEVLAAEVTLTDDTKLGIEWALRSGKFLFTNTQNTGGVLPRLPPSSIIPGPGNLGGGTALPLGFNMFTFAASEFISALNALASENKVNVLSSPSIMTSENKKAVINVSTSVPIVTSQQVPVSAGGNTGNSITQTVEYKDAGIILTVTPRIGERGTVSLDVKQEVNDVGANEPPPINSPRFRKREAETSVVLLNNQTLVLGGLLQNKRTFIRTGIPLLNKIPVLGYLFGSTEEVVEKTELLLLITPRVVGTAVDAARVTEQMRNVTPELEQSLKLAPNPPPRTLSPLESSPRRP